METDPAQIRKQAIQDFARRLRDVMDREGRNWIDRLDVAAVMASMVLEETAWREGPVECVRCGRQWVAVRPEGTQRALECPDCGGMAGFEPVRG